LRAENETLRHAVSELVLESRGLSSKAAHNSLVAQQEAGPTYATFIQERYLPWARAAKRSAPWEDIILRCHLLPAFGALSLGSIARDGILTLVAEKKAAGYARGTINRQLSILKVTLNKAIEWKIGGLAQSPAEGVKLLKDPPKMERYLTQEEAQRLIREIRACGSSMLRYIVPFLLFTGARKREALDARWRDINFAQRLWTIPFTKSGKPRTVPLSDEALAVLVKLRDMSLSDKWIFPSPETGRPYVTIFHSWNKCRRAVGLADVRIHDLRHSFASALINNGMTIYDVKEALGHANIVTTQRYSHLSPDRLRKAVKQAGAHYADVAE
jgi:integrase